MNYGDELRQIRGDIQALADEVELQGSIRDAQHKALMEHLAALQDLAVALLRTQDKEKDGRCQ
jgi:hypothetical protein